MGLCLLRFQHLDSGGTTAHWQVAGPRALSFPFARPDHPRSSHDVDMFRLYLQAGMHVLFLLLIRPAASGRIRLAKSSLQHP